MSTLTENKLPAHTLQYLSSVFKNLYSLSASLQNVHEGSVPRATEHSHEWTVQNSGEWRKDHILHRQSVVSATQTINRSKCSLPVERQLAISPLVWWTGWLPCTNNPPRAKCCRCSSRHQNSKRRGNVPIFQFVEHLPCMMEELLSFLRLALQL